MTKMQRIDGPACGCDRPEQIRKLTSVEDALRRIAETISPVEPNETVPLSRAHGRILAAPVRSATMAPPFDNSAMDGYAVSSASLKGEGPWQLTVADRVPAGGNPSKPVAGLQAVRIFTGAPLPAGADAVVQQEDVTGDGDLIGIRHRPFAGLNVRRAGSDMAAGEIVLHAGKRIGQRSIAACAAAGAGVVTVRRPIRVGLLVTGDEVRPSGGSRREGTQIWDVNTPMLAAALSDASVDLSICLHGADNREGIADRLDVMSRQVDLIVTTGGISVGEEDHVKPALRSLGGEIAFSGVAIKPGKPVSFGRVGSALWLGLPGNPLAAFVTWHLFGTAILHRLCGQADEARPARRLVSTGHPIRRKPGRAEFRLARLAGRDDRGREVVSFENATHSGRVGGLPDAGGLIVLPADRDWLPEGALVEFQPFCEN